MFHKVIQTARGKWAVAIIVIAVVGAIASLAEGVIDTEALLGAAILIVIAVALIASVIKTINTPASVLWRKWADVPMNDAQLRRLERGIECGFTPQKVNLDAKFAIITGSEMNPYKTTLTRCTCPDFKKRNLPCKHMYFLALQTEAIYNNGKAK